MGEKMNKRRETETGVPKAGVSIPMKFLLVMVVTIFMAEALVMLLMSSLPAASIYATALADSLLLSLVIVPALYLLLFRPMALYLRERDSAEKMLLEARDKLEHKVWERTTELSIANKSLHETIARHKAAEQRLSYLLSSSPAVIYTAIPGDNYRISFVSENIRGQFGRSVNEFLDDPGLWARGIHQSDRERVVAGIPELLEKERSVHEYRFWRGDGAYRWVRDEMKLVKGENGAPDEVVGCWIDITERVELEEELKRIATTDKLTGAYNRARFDELIAFEMERARRFKHALSVLILDLDNFKYVNDTFGHLAGDHALKTVAEIMRGHMRKINHLVRWGGDEFVVIPLETDINGARMLSERLREAIEAFEFDKRWKITASFGIAQFRIDDTADSFLARADEALFRAKRCGGNCIEQDI